MFCTLCEKHSKVGPLVSGTDNFRLKTLTKHVKSNEHKGAIAAEAPGQQVLPATLTAAQERRNGSIIAALRTVYWIVTEEIANRKYASLLKLQRLQGCVDVQNLRIGGNASYDSPDIFNQLLSALNEVVEERIDSKLRLSPCIGVGIDESTDRSNEKHIVAVARYIDLESANVATTFVKCREVEDGRASGIYNSMKGILNEKRIPMRKVGGLGTDGASVMTGHLNGVTMLMRTDNPHCISVHCVCHRLNLAVSQACKNVPDMSSLTNIISAIYNYICQSPKRAERLKDLNEIIQEKNIKLKRIYEIRWLSMGDAVTAIIRNYEALLLLTSQEAALGDPTAIGLNKQLSTYIYLALLHLASEVLSVTNHLSKVFQYRDVCFSTVRGNLNDCIETLEDLRNTNGPVMTAMEAEINAAPIGQFKGSEIDFRARRGEPDQRQKFEQVKLEFINLLIGNIRARFPNVDLLSAMEIFEPQSYPADQRLLVGWGNGNLQTLLDHYGCPMENQLRARFDSVVDSEACRGEFLPFKRLLHHNLGENRQNDAGVVRWHYYTPVEVMKHTFGDRMQVNQAIFPGKWVANGKL